MSIPDLGKTTVSYIELIDQSADQFEKLWRDGGAPRIEDFVDRAPLGARQPLLEELIRVETQLRIAAGEFVDPAEYSKRFPALDGRLERLCGHPDWPSLARYELIEKIGRGSSGDVYLARRRDRIDDHRRALKLLKQADSPLAALRFLGEIKCLEQFQHQSVVPILDSGCEDDWVYFVMPHYAAGDLAGALKQQPGPLPLATAAEYVRRIVGAVAYLHRKGVVHRDLKPSNILLDDTRDRLLPLGCPRLADFGLAMLHSSEAASEGLLVVEGTIPYMAPEQAKGRLDKVGSACDIWALGVLLFELVTGSRPFHGSSSNDLRRQIVYTEPPLLRSLRPDAPRDLQRIVNKCLRKDPGDRYASAEDLEEDLHAFLRNEPLLHAPPFGAWERLERWTRRRPALAIRWSVFAIVLLNIWVHHGLALHATGHHTDPVFWPNQGLFLFWALLSWLFQGMADHYRNERNARVAWVVSDVLLLTLMIGLIGAVDTPLVAAYPALVVASGLWLETRLVGLSMLLSIIGYLALVVRAPQPIELIHVLHVVTVVAATGVIVRYQIRRSRALRRLSESRPSL
jgi:tRNA A-37 threonylcarbamoyl transferase component Bud32